MSEAPHQGPGFRDQGSGKKKALSDSRYPLLLKLTEVALVLRHVPLSTFVSAGSALRGLRHEPEGQFSPTHTLSYRNKGSWTRVICSARLQRSGPDNAVSDSRVTNCSCRQQIPSGTTITLLSRTTNPHGRNQSTILDLFSISS
jgi:hypothetical protein